MTPEEKKAIQNPFWHHPEYPVGAIFVSKSIGDFTVLEHGYQEIKVRSRFRTEWIENTYMAHLLKSGQVSRKVN